MGTYWKLMKPIHDRVKYLEQMYGNLDELFEQRSLPGDKSPGGSPAKVAGEVNK